MLCNEFRDIFSDTLSDSAADIPPFELIVDDNKWASPKLELRLDLNLLLIKLILLNKSLNLSLPVLLKSHHLLIIVKF